MSIPSVSASIASESSSTSSSLSSSTSLNISFDAIVTTFDISKSVTSALISTYSGSSNVSESRFRSSDIPGSANPTAIVLEPSSITLPFETSTFVKLSSSKIIPVSIINGTAISSFLPSIVTVSYLSGV